MIQDNKIDTPPAVTQPDGIQRTWYGDIGRSCGQWWYMSGQVEGTIAGTGDNFWPSCTWFDQGDPSEPYPASAKIDIFKYFADTSNIDPTQD
jgi:hypothetical protein